MKLFYLQVDLWAEIRKIQKKHIKWVMNLQKNN